MARLNSPPRVHTGGSEIDRAFDLHRQAFSDAFRFEELRGARLDGVTIDTSDTVVAHPLGRSPMGWRLVDKRGAGDVYRISWNERTLTLRASVGVDVDLWVW